VYILLYQRGSANEGGVGLGITIFPSGYVERVNARVRRKLRADDFR